VALVGFIMAVAVVLVVFALVQAYLLLLELTIRLLSAVVVLPYLLLFKETTVAILYLALSLLLVAAVLVTVTD
jgi:hypothetical protein